MPPALSISKEALGLHLSNVDIDDPQALRSFVRLLRDTCAPMPTIPASSLSLMEVFKLFRFSNEIQRRFNAEVPIIRNNFRVVPDECLERTSPRLWLEQTLDYMGMALTARDGVSRHTFIKMLLTAALAELPRTSPSLRISCGLPLSCYMRSPSTNESIAISGVCDLAVGYEPEGIQVNGSPPAFEPYMVVMEAKEEGALETAFTQLLAHMGMLQAARTSARLVIVPVFGAVSDGYRYTFVRLGRKGKVTRTPEVSIIQHFGRVYTLAVRILSVVEDISVAVSPLKPRRTVSMDIREVPSRAESRPFYLEALQEALGAREESAVI